MTLTRRAYLASLSVLAATGVSPAAWGLGRIPWGGELILKVPWPVDALDPHAISNFAGFVFGQAVAEPIFQTDAKGRPYPTLASTLPATRGSGTIVELRPGLKTAAGRKLTARDLLWSFERARLRAARGLLLPLGQPSLLAANPLALRFPKGSPGHVARVLSSPATSLLPRGFHPKRPDGTGAFRALLKRGRLDLSRNLLAARGPAYLNRIRVSTASSLGEALRSFESGEADVGWLGSGLHRVRPGSRAFDAGAKGWVVLMSGAAAGTWGAPGVAAQLLDGIEASRLARFSLGRRPVGARRVPWGGPPSNILVPADSPYLIELGTVIAAALSQTGHELAISKLPRAEFDRRRRKQAYALLLDVVRPVGDASQTGLALATAVDPALARHAPRPKTADPRVHARTLPLGIVGELRVSGYVVPRVQGLPGWDLGSCWRG